jgi:hypothetical protein
MLRFPTGKFLVVEGEQIEKFIKELNDIKESWEMRLVNIEDRLKKLEAKTKERSARA